MSPEVVDEAILAQCGPYFFKVLRIVLDVAKAARFDGCIGRSFLRQSDFAVGPLVEIARRF